MKTKTKEKKLTDKIPAPELENGVHPELVGRETALRAYQLFVERGCTHGFDLEDWLQAEREMLFKYS